MGAKKVIRASEIGEYVYCKRAWWFHHVQGVEPGNIEELSLGEVSHFSHGRAVMYGELLKKAAVFLILLSIIIAVVWAVTSIGAGVP